MVGGAPGTGLAPAVVVQGGLVGGVMLAGAAAMLWAAQDSHRTVMVVLAVALAVNGLAIAMLFAVLRGRRR